MSLLLYPPLQALGKTGSILGSSPLRVLPSKTAIVPVNKELMPRTNDELERCSRTVYVANIDKKVDKEDVRSFFEQLCGEGGRAAGVGSGVGRGRVRWQGCRRSMRRGPGAAAVPVCSEGYTPTDGAPPSTGAPCTMRLGATKAHLASAMLKCFL